MKNDITLFRKKIISTQKIQLPISKSECNRALIISLISHKKVTIENISDAEDSQTLFHLTNEINSTQELNCGPAGTNFRFLTAALSIRNGEFTLTGSDRMKERPISELVDALNKLGADISYLEKNGFPPLKIIGRNILGGKIDLNPSISSQFVSALMMIAPELKNGLELHFNSKPVSFPYIKMTAEMMNLCGAKVEYNENEIQISPLPYQNKKIHCENDWSAASYFYSMVAVDPTLKILLPGLKLNSLQGDSIVKEIYSVFGIETIFKENEIEIFNNKDIFCDYFEYDFTDCPDLAQTLAFTCCALRISGKMTGLSTLKNKETDRIIALKNEMEKCGIKVEITSDSIKFSPEYELQKNMEIKTYDDHRMAMSASVMSLVCDSVTIENKKVVAKSFPQFWEECSSIFNIK
jgi:3-phosphoshikimate 1-carboxyvinyltransferase